MPRGRAPRGRGRTARRDSLTRQTRSRSAASSDSPPLPSVSFGTPPPQCASVENFEDASDLQAVVRDSIMADGPQSLWECAMERRVTASEKVLGEIHAMVLALRPTPTVLRPDPALASASAAFGSAAQMSAAAGMGPSSAGLTHPFAMPGPVSADPVDPLSFGARDARATPWPNTDTVPGTAVFEALPGPAQAMIDSCSSASLPLDARIPDGLRAKIWAGEYIDLAIMLKPTRMQHLEYGHAYGGAPTATNVVAKSPNNTHEFISFEKWLQAFNLYMAVYLLKPANMPLAVQMLKYAKIIRGLADAGGDWRSYDEAFRSLRYLRGWSWGSINWEMWMTASQFIRRPASVPPFSGKGGIRSMERGPCFAFNRGEMCEKTSCRFVHKCSVCGGSSHRAIRCFQAQGRRPQSANPPTQSPPGRSVLPSKPSFSQGRPPTTPSRPSVASGSPASAAGSPFWFRK